MKYQNARDVLPDELLTSVQEYFQGGYLYVPRKAENRPEQFRTAYKTELLKRDHHIFLKHLEGWSNGQLGEFYHLSASSIRRFSAASQIQNSHSFFYGQIACELLGKCPGIWTHHSFT